MIGSFTETSLTVANLALALEQLGWPQDPDSYARIRADVRGFVDDLGLHEVVVPEDQDVFLADVGVVTNPIMARLSEIRGRIGGDTVALPIYFLERASLRYALMAPFGEDASGEMEIVESCLEDLGVETDFARDLEREVGWIVVLTDQGEPSIRQADVIKAGSAFVLRAIEAWSTTEQGLEGVREALSGLQAEVADFREEFRATSRQLERLIVEGNQDVLAAIAETKAVLVDVAGVDPAEAAELTDEDPRGFWERVVRWVGGAQARDAAEAALWAALDFVPAGTGVKLGIKVAGAIRKAVKSAPAAAPARARG